MKIKHLAQDAFEVVAVVEDGGCPAEAFIVEGEADTRASRDGLMWMIRMIAERGLQGVPSAWIHEAGTKKGGVFRIEKGPLRLFFFKGHGKQIAVCACGARKKGQKSDKGAVARSAAMKRAYFQAIASNTLEIENED